MTISVGDSIPNVKVMLAGESGPQEAQTADVLGGGKGPTLAELGARGYADRRLEMLLRRIMNKGAEPAEVKRLAAQIESTVADKKPLQQRLAAIVKRIVNGAKFNEQGTEAARAQLQSWAEKYGAQAARKRTPE